MGVEAIFISAHHHFEWFNFKATRTDGATAENVKHLERSVPTGFGPQHLIRSELRNGRGSDLHLRTTAVEWLNFQGNATRTDGATVENVKQVEFSVPTAFVPQNLIRFELCNRRGSDLHLRASAVRKVFFFRVKRREPLELQLKT